MSDAALCVLFASIGGATAVACIAASAASSDIVKLLQTWITARAEVKKIEATHARVCPRMTDTPRSPP